MSYTEVFGGGTIKPSDVSLLALALSADIQLSWSIEANIDVPVAAKIMQVTPAGAGFEIAMPDATEVSTGEDIMFWNAGSDDYTVTDLGGNTLAVVASGEMWYLYLVDNTATNGVWNSFLFGSGSSSSDAAALAGYGLVAISTKLNQSTPIFTHSTDYTFLASDRASMQVWTGGAGSFDLGDPTALTTGWFVSTRNNGSGVLTLDRNGHLIDGGSLDLELDPGRSITLVTDGTNWYTLGFVQNQVPIFDFISISVNGAGDYILSGVELNRIAYQFTGALTGDRTIIVPNSVQQYWVDNATTGAYNFYVKTAAQTAPGLNVVQGKKAIFYCDGTVVVDADTQSPTSPVPIVDGGTGADNALDALTNLGGSPTGILVFAAPDAATARAVLNVFSADETVAIAVALG